MRDEAEQKGPSEARGLAGLIAARRVAKRYGSRVALEPVDLEIAAGEIVALVGPNGAGKSTLLSILARSLQPSEGRVEIGPGVRVGWMPQRPAHYSRLSARQNLELFARLEDEPDATARADELLARFDIPADGRPSANLSVGNRQRLNLALALLGSPRVLLVDEPTASLDAAQRERFWQTAEALRAEGGSVVLVTQNAEDVERLADRVLRLDEGRVVE